MHIMRPARQDPQAYYSGASCHVDLGPRGRILDPARQGTDPRPARDPVPTRVAIDMMHVAGAT